MFLSVKLQYRFFDKIEVLVILGKQKTNEKLNNSYVSCLNKKRRRRRMEGIDVAGD